MAPVSLGAAAAFLAHTGMDQPEGIQDAVLITVKLRPESSGAGVIVVIRMFSLEYLNGIHDRITHKAGDSAVIVRYFAAQTVGSAVPTFAVRMVTQPSTRPSRATLPTPAKLS